ncbi:MAG TPA: AMP-binding protein, partial [Steroidobacteraceae bacterium]|nr:AMP-binding protein [Steroidobacteraceae bacterium]
MDKVWLQSYPPGVPEHIDPSAYGSLTQMIEESLARFRERGAFVQMGRELTFGELDALSRDFAAWLQSEAGLRKGDRVAIMLPNILQYPIAMCAILRAGLVVVNTNPLYTPRELEHQLKDSGARAILILENFAHVLQEVIEHTDVRKVIVTAVGDFLH